jgi:hypothetical protein
MIAIQTQCSTAFKIFSEALHTFGLCHTEDNQAEATKFSHTQPEQLLAHLHSHLVVG